MTSFSLASPPAHRLSDSSHLPAGVKNVGPEIWINREAADRQASGHTDGETDTNSQADSPINIETCIHLFKIEATGNKLYECKVDIKTINTQ